MIDRILHGKSYHSGDLLYLEFHIVESKEQRSDSTLFGFMQEHHLKIRDDVEREVKKLLGKEYEIREFKWREGSLTIWITIGTIYYAISRYKSFCESIQLMMSQLKSLFRSIFSNAAGGHIDIDASWGISYQFDITPNTNDYYWIRLAFVLLLYLILSNAALLYVVLAKLVLWK